MFFERDKDATFTSGLACGILRAGSGTLTFYGPLSSSILLLTSPNGQLSVYSSASAENITASSGYTFFVNETLSANYVTTRNGGAAISVNGVATTGDVRIAGGSTNLYGGLAANNLHVGSSAQFTVEIVFNGIIIINY